MQIAEIIAELRNQLEELADEGKRAEAIPEFMGLVYELGLQISHTPQARESEELRAFLSTSWEPLRPLLAYVELHYIGRLEALLNSAWVADEWLTACRRRSAVQWLNELYAGLIDESLLLDTEEVDQEIRRRAEDEAFQDPARTPRLPASHWWWRLGA